MNKDNPTPDQWGLVMSFWIDTDGYSDRDRLMFTCGVEYEMTRQGILNEDGCGYERLIHRENESRVRMMCGKLGRQCRITPHAGYEGCEVWSELEVADIGGEFLRDKQ